MIDDIARTFAGGVTVGRARMSDLEFMPCRAAALSRSGRHRRPANSSGGQYDEKTAHSHSVVGADTKLTQGAGIR